MTAPTVGFSSPLAPVLVRYLDLKQALATLRWMKSLKRPGNGTPVNLTFPQPK